MTDDYQRGWLEAIATAEELAATHDEQYPRGHTAAAKEGRVEKLCGEVIANGLHSLKPKDEQSLADIERRAELQVLAEVNRRAENRILRGEPITGAHHRSIEERIAELKAKLKRKGGNVK